MNLRQPFMEGKTAYRKKVDLIGKKNRLLNDQGLFSIEFWRKNFIFDP